MSRLNFFKPTQGFGTQTCTWLLAFPETRSFTRSIVHMCFKNALAVWGLKNRIELLRAWRLHIHHQNPILKSAVFVYKSRSQLRWVVCYPRGEDGATLKRLAFRSQKMNPSRPPLTGVNWRGETPLQFTNINLRRPFKYRTLTLQADCVNYSLQSTHISLSFY